MGMYTEVYFRAEVSREAAEIMERARDFYTVKYRQWPDRPFFATERFSSVFNCESAYFPGSSHFTHVHAEDDGYAKYGPDAEKWSIVEFRNSLKNYSGEVGKFFDWVRPHVRPGGGGGEFDFIGYSLYEEGDIIPYYRDEEQS